MQQIIKLAKKLEALGLEPKDARVYVAALFLGSAPAQKIAEQAGVNRVTTYDSLESLKKMGLVTESKEGKKTVFVAEDPESLDKFIDSQIRELSQHSLELNKLLPEMKEIHREKGVASPVVRFFKGKEGLSEISQYQRRKAVVGSEIYSVSNLDEVSRLFPEALKYFPKQRLKKKISSKIIYSYSDGVLKSSAEQRREGIRVNFPVKADINLYEDTASLSTYRGRELIGILIENKEIVGALRQLFELAWDNIKKKR